MDSENLRDNLLLFVSDDSKGVLYVNAKHDQQINSLFEEFDLTSLFITKYINRDKKFEDFKAATLRALSMFCFCEDTDDDSEWYEEYYHKKYEEGWEECEKVLRHR